MSMLDYFQRIHQNISSSPQISTDPLQSDDVVFITEQRPLSKSKRISKSILSHIASQHQSSTLERFLSTAQPRSQPKKDLISQLISAQLRGSVTAITSLQKQVRINTAEMYRCCAFWHPELASDEQQHVYFSLDSSKMLSRRISDCKVDNDGLLCVVTTAAGKIMRCYTQDISLQKIGHLMLVDLDEMQKPSYHNLTIPHYTDWNVTTVFHLANFKQV